MILSLSDHCCIRVIKQGLALQRAGHSMVYMCRRVANADMETVLPLLSKWRTHDELRAKLAGCGPFEIIHVHNEPSDLVSIARECCPNATIIFDCHDLDACRGDLVNAAESVAFADCDGVIFPSEPYSSRANGWFKFDRPYGVVYSACEAGMLKQVQQLARLGGIVYQGSTSFQSQTYLDYREIANRCHEQGIPFSIIQASAENTAEYMQCGAHVYGPLPYMGMLSELTRYDYGLCAPGIAAPQWNRTIPNKLFEYIAAGIPVLCWGCDATAQIVREYGIGEVLTGADELTTARYAGLLARRDLYAGAVADLRERLTMDAQVQTIENVYTAAKSTRRRNLTRRYIPRPKISFVTGTLNRINGLIAMVQSIRANVSVPYEIIAVDGGSTDGTEAWCCQQTDVTVIQQGGKRGAVAAYNQGFSACSGDIVVHLNDDAVVSGNLDRLVGVFEENPRLGQVAFRWADPNMPLDVQYTPPVGVYNTAVPYANFGAVRRVAGEQAGWWGEWQHYAGDCELTLNLRRLGWETGVTDLVRVLHMREQDETRQHKNEDLLPFKRKWFLREVY